MPSDMDRPSTVKQIAKSKDLQRIEIPMDNTDTFNVYYQIWRTGTLQLLKVVGLQQDDLITVDYSRILYDMVNDSDVCPIP